MQENCRFLPENAKRGSKMAKEFFMKEQAVSVHDLYHIYDAQGVERYQIKGKLLSLHDSTSLLDMEGTELARIHKKIVSLHETHFIEVKGETLTEIRSEWFHPIHPKIDAPGLGWQIQGNLLEHDFTVVDGEGYVHITVHRQWVSLGDGYQVVVENDQEVVPALALMVALERILTDRRSAHSGTGSGPSK